MDFRKTSFNRHKDHKKNPVPLLHSILESPIVSTSANFHGGPELKSFAEVENELSGIVDFILEGPQMQTQNLQELLIYLQTK